MSRAAREWYRRRQLQDACTKHIPLWAAAISALLRLSHFDGDTISLGVEIVKGRVHRIGSLREGSSSSNVSGAGLPAWRGTLPCQGGRAKPGKRGGASPSPTPLYGGVFAKTPNPRDFSQGLGGFCHSGFSIPKNRQPFAVVASTTSATVRFFTRAMVSATRYTWRESFRLPRKGSGER